jgi:glycosyltransferase involved in cell wall biosynthesis
MNVVILNDSASVNGGAAKVALDEARSLAAAGHQVQLVCGVGPIQEDLRNRANLVVHCLDEHDIRDDPNRLRAMARGWWNSASRKVVDRILDSLNPDETVVHAHNWTKALSPSVMASALDRKFELIITLHDFLLACPNGLFFLHPTQKLCTLRPMSGACISTNCDSKSYRRKLYRLGRYAVQDRLGHIPSEVKHFVYFSDVAHGVLRPHLPGDAHFHWLPHAIDVDQAAAVNSAANDTFMYIGRLEREKGPELFARAAAAERVPCRFIGEGTSREAIKKANQQAVLSGWMGHKESMLALRNARALVFPSLWYETLGLVVLEAAAIGVPSIVPDSCAASESVVDGETGLHFRSGDESDLREKIQRMNDPKTAARMGRAAYDRFWKPPGCSSDLHRQRLERIYSQVLAGRRTAA